jgi:hypothetical protein
LRHGGVDVRGEFRRLSAVSDPCVWGTFTSGSKMWHKDDYR